MGYKEAFFEESSAMLCIVMEYASAGDLSNRMAAHKKAKTWFPEPEIWKIFTQVVRALKHLHQMKICHRDIKAANIYLFPDNVAKLGDMNVSKIAKAGMLHTQTGTPYYASPEVWKDHPYDVKSDIWSLGCVLYETITLKPPFRAEDMPRLYKKVLRGVYPKIPVNYSQDLAAIVKLLLQVSPHLRPSCGKTIQ